MMSLRLRFLCTALFALTLSIENSVASVLDDVWAAQSEGAFKLFLDDGNSLTRARLEKCLSKKDFKNGFLEIECDDFVNRFQAAIFQATGGRRILVFVEDGASVENSYYLERVAGKWVDVREKVFPAITDATLKKAYLKAFPEKEKSIDASLAQSAHSRYRTSLPRKGTTITLEAGLSFERRTLFHLAWDRKKGQFQFSESWLK